MNTPTSPTAAVLLIGNELLSGRTEDANLNYIARRLNDVGIKLTESRVVRDDETAVADALNTLRAQYTYVFTTGGIGPTHDDITHQCVAKAFKVALETRDDVVEMINASYDKSRMTKATYNMAQYPVGADTVLTSASSIPVCRMENVFVLAGIPTVMQSMFESILPTLTHGETIYTKSVEVMLGEGKVSAELAKVQQKFPQVEIGSYPFKREDKHGTSLVTRGTNREAVDKAHADITQFLTHLGAEYA